MINRQLELGLENRGVCQSPKRRRLGRAVRARWWFQRMRGLVEDAHDWEPTVPAPQNAPATVEAPEPAAPPSVAAAETSSLNEPRLAETAPRWRFVRIRGVEE